MCLICFRSYTSCILKWNWVYSGCVASLRIVGVFSFSLMGAIFCSYKCAVKQILCQRTMENEDHEVKSYPLIRAAVQCMGGGSMSLPQCKERMESSGKSQPPMKLQNLWLHPVFPHSTSWISLWPCLCRAASHCHACLCLQPAKSHWSRGLFLLSSLRDTRLLWEVTLITHMQSSHSAVQFSVISWFYLKERKRLKDAVCHILSRSLGLTLASVWGFCGGDVGGVFLNM